jgi:hypothetical protein
MRETAQLNSLRVRPRLSRSIKIAPTVGAAVDDESSQDNEKHNCGGDRPPVIFAPPWVGPPSIVTRATSAFKMFVYHIGVRFVISIG